MSGSKGGGSEVVTQNPDFDYAPLTNDVLQALFNTTKQRLRHGEALHPLQEESLAQQVDLARQGGQLLPGATDVLGDIMGGAFVNPALAETQRIAMGGDVGTNPYLEATYERASRPLLQQLQQDVNPAIDIGAASAGRTGGGLHALLRNRAGEQTGQALTDLATNIYGGAYESDQARRMAALGQLGGLGQQDVANRLAAAGVAPGFDQARFADAERLLGIGQTYQDAPYRLGQQYMNIAATAPNTVGSTTTSMVPGTSQFGSALAGGLGGASLLSSFGPYGALAGGGLGLLSGLLSDERAKDEIEPIGITVGGTPLYRYHYTDDPTETKHIGVLAQEVAETQPEAVFLMPDGMLGVDYGKVA